MSASHKPWEHAKASGSETDPLAARFVASLDYDKRLYRDDIRGSMSHAHMLKIVGLISAEDYDAIIAGLEEIKSEIDEQGDAWPGWKVELEDVHMCVEAALIEKAGDAGRKLHTGRSRNDQVATDIKLWIYWAAHDMQKRIQSLNREFVNLSEEYGTIVMPSYTHLQRAQPIVVGGELLAWAAMFDNDERRLSDRQFNDRMGSMPLGSGAIAGSSLPVNAMHVLAELEEFMEPSVNAIERTASRDDVLDFTFTLTMISMHLSRWAEQWIIYATTEFGFITLADTYTTGSSMMPQKQNPDMLELIRGKTGQVYGSLIALLTMCKGITVGYNRDLQEDKRHLFAAYDAVCDCLDMAAGIVRTTTFNEERIKAGLDKGYLDATSLAEYLVTKGVPFRTSHQIVGKMVGLCEERGIGMLKKLEVSDFNAVCKEYDAGEPVGEDIFDWLGPENVVKRYQSAGNAGVSGFEAQLKAWKERLSEG